MGKKIKAGAASVVLAASVGAGKVYTDDNPVMVSQIRENVTFTTRMVVETDQGPEIKYLWDSEVEALAEAGIETYEDRVYSIDMGCKCDTKVIAPAPSDGPITDPIPWNVAKVQADKAMAVTRAEDILVCVLDTGTDYEHEDLKENLDGGFSTVDGVSDWADDNGHGTHVSGTISGVANGFGIVGASQAKILTGKVMDSSGRGFGSWITMGIRACIDRGAHIINMSLGTPRIFRSPSTGKVISGANPDINKAVSDAIKAGIKVVAAAGNDGGQVNWPAALPGTITVSASDHNDNITAFSSRGPEVNVMAPGLSILSTKMGGGYTQMSGTSMATPLVSGVLALALASGNELACDDVGLPAEHQGTCGRVNALKSVGKQ